MQTSSRPREHPPPGRRRHAPQISVSDENHHVTEAIGSLYGYGEQQSREQQARDLRQQQAQSQPQARSQNPPPPSQAAPPARLSPQPSERPLSFVPSAREEIHRAPPSSARRYDPATTSFSHPRPPSLARAVSDQTPKSAAAGRLSNSHRHAPNGTSAAEPAAADGPAPTSMVGRSNTTGHGLAAAGASGGAAASPPLPSPAETANAKFPLANIDYESSPAAVAQELSNLQAIRRMSMDVNVAGDPDLPGFGSAGAVAAMPTIAPTKKDEEDASNLFWVPARLHPELAPKEFKTFLDGRIQSMKRKSAEFSAPADGPARSGSGSGLRRKKSMLSRQIDNSNGRGADGYQDGAERLERKRSAGAAQAIAPSSGDMTNLQELEEMMTDPDKVVHRLSLEAQQRAAAGAAAKDGRPADVPILPALPGGSSLRRSTRTTYGRGSLKKGERVPPSKRAAQLADADAEDARSPSPLATAPAVDAPDVPPANRMRSESTPPASTGTPPAGLGRIPEQRPPENFSRPHARGPLRNRSGIGAASVPPPGPSPPPQIPPVQTAGPPTSFDSIFSAQQAQSPIEAPDRVTSPPQQSISPPPSQRREPKPFVSKLASNGRSTARFADRDDGRVPAIVETPPADDGSHRPKSPPSSRQPQRSPEPHARGPHAPRGSKRSNLGPRAPDQEPATMSLQHMAAHPSPLPGNSTRTDNLSFIPTLSEDPRASGLANESSAPHRKDSSGSTKKSGWSLSALLGSDEKDKDKERQRRSEEEQRNEAAAGRKPKSKLGGRPSDSTRLDVLQTTMEGGSGGSGSGGPSSPRGRESLVLDRGDVRLEEERRKESSRKASGGEPKREKDGLLSSLFGGSKKKPAKDAAAANAGAGGAPGSAGSDAPTAKGGRGKAGSALRALSPAALESRESALLRSPPATAAAPLKPDVDYNWTRFSILEERAIYRMAHIKLANPRRSLHSQVLLSNFMYSYLAKVQQMHPQIQIPQTAAQKAQQRLQQQQQAQQAAQQAAQQQQQQQQQHAQQQQQAQGQGLSGSGSGGHGGGRAKDAETPEEYYQYQRYQEEQEAQASSSDSPTSPDSPSQPYGYEGANGHANGYGQAHDGYAHAQGQGSSSQAPGGLPYQKSQFDDPGRSEDDDMW